MQPEIHSTKKVVEAVFPKPRTGHWEVNSDRLSLEPCMHRCYVKTPRRTDVVNFRCLSKIYSLLFVAITLRSPCWCTYSHMVMWWYEYLALLSVTSGTLVPPDKGLLLLWNQSPNYSLEISSAVNKINKILIHKCGRADSNKVRGSQERGTEWICINYSS